MARNTKLKLIASNIRKLPRRVGHVLRLALRKAKLLILLALTKWKAPNEEPKVVVYKHRGIALLNLFTLCVPLGGVLALLVLNFNTYFIGDLSASATTALQFAAKLLELLMQASLAVILLDVLRWQVIRSQDFPFGGLVASLRTADVSYLWSLELWGFLTSKSWRGYRKFYLGLLIFSTVVLAALVGPSGAVAMIPRRITLATSQYLEILNPADNLFPLEISYLDDSPAFELGITQLRLGGNDQAEILDDDGIRIFGKPSNLGLSWSSATIPSRHMSNILRSRTANAKDVSPFDVFTMKTSQALVQCACQTNGLYNFQQNKTFLSFPGPDLNTLVTWNETLEHATDNGTFLFFADPPSSAAFRPSTLMVFGTTAPADRSYVATAETCNIQATWTSATLNVSAAHFAQTVGYVLDKTYEGSIPQPEIIHFPRNWTDRVQSAIQGSKVAYEFLFYPACEQIFALLLSNSDTSYLIYRSENVKTPWNPYSKDAPDPEKRALYAYLNETDAWNKYAGILLDISDPENVALSQPSSLTYQVISQLQQGYGYSADGVAVRLSLVVLGLFCLFVLSHVVFVLLTGYTATSWDDISDLLMLGLMSKKPDHLSKHAAAGLETMNIYREPVSIRVNDEGQVELVFENSTSAKAAVMEPVEVNKAY